jgi:hypothetical protein
VNGREYGSPPRTVEWEAEQAPLARYVSSKQWSAVSDFYDGLLTVEPSLSTRCITDTETLDFASAVARKGDAAYRALRGESVPNVELLDRIAAHPGWRC